MAKFGQLYLQNGRWQDRTIIDADFVVGAWRPSAAASQYGLFWWRWVREYPGIGPVHFAAGFKGQRVYVVPKHRVVIALSANISDADVGEAYPALVRAVVSAVQNDGPINRSPSDADWLAEQLRLPFSGEPGNAVRPQDLPASSSKIVLPMGDHRRTWRPGAEIGVHHHAVPCTTNPIGAKGAGEIRRGGLAALRGPRGLASRPADDTGADVGVAAAGRIARGVEMVTLPGELPVRMHDGRTGTGNPPGLPLLVVRSSNLFGRATSEYAIDANYRRFCA